MKKPENAIMVLDIAGTKARVELTAPAAGEPLLRLGFLHEGDRFVRAIVDDNDRVQLVNALAQAGALFMAGTGWSPAELLDLYVAQGRCSVPYHVISWVNPDEYVVTRRA